MENTIKSGIANLMNTLLKIREKNVEPITDAVTLDKDMGKWAVKLNGVVIDEYFRLSAAERLATRIRAGLDNRK